VIRATSIRVATGLIEEVVADCNGNASRKGDLRARCTSASGVGVSGRGEVGRVASAMFAIDRAANSRLDRDALDRESDAVGDLTGSSDWVLSQLCATGAGAVAEGFGAAGRLTVLVAAISAAIAG
jgi:hypothetical protein